LFCQDLKIPANARFGILKESMFNGGGGAFDFPCLKGKANIVKHLGPPLREAFKKVMNKRDQVHRWISQALTHSCHMDDIMDRYKHEYKLPPRASKDLVKTAFSFCQLSTALSQHFHPQRIVLFNFTIKFHYILHCALMSQYLNPSQFWCYAGEDMMQRIKRVIVACHDGTPAHVLVSKAMSKYAQGLGYTLTEDSLVTI